MSMQKLIIIFLTSFLLLGSFSQSHADRRSKSKAPHAKSKPVVKPPTRSIRDLRKVSIRLGNEKKRAVRRQNAAGRDVRRARELEKTAEAAYKRIAPAKPLYRPSDDKRFVTLEENTARRTLDNARRERANAQVVYRDRKAKAEEAARQSKAANRTLSLARKGDWSAAYTNAPASASAKPKPRLRKIKFNLGLREAGSGYKRKGILKPPPPPQSPPPPLPDR